MADKKRDENTKTEIVNTETVYLGKEHLHFLDSTIQKLTDASGYKSTKSQIIRLLVEGAMRRTMDFHGVESEADLRQRLNSIDDSEPPRIRKNPPKPA